IKKKENSRVEMSREFSVVPFKELKKVYGQRPWQEIGRGGSSTVFRINLDEQIVCAKRANGEKYCIQFEKEVSYLQVLNGAGGAPVPLCMSKKPTCLVMTYKGDKCFDDFLDESSPIKCLCALFKLTIRLNEIHRKGVLHGDLKMDNIMIQNESHPYNFIVNIVDFGLAQRLGEKRRIYRIKSPHYPPESHCAGKASESFDVFSLGMIILQVYEMIENKGCSEELKYLAMAMMQNSLKKRPNLSFVMESLLEILEKYSESHEEDYGEDSEESSEEDSAESSEEDHGESSEEDPGESSEEDHGESSEEDPGESSEEDPGESSEEDPGESSEEDPGESSEEDPGESSEEDPGESSEEDPGESSEEDPGESSEEDPGESSVEVPVEEVAEAKEKVAEIVSTQKSPLWLRITHGLCTLPRQIYDFFDVVPL
ncbi:hypothetical protein OTU49_001435, partial [Cherax quadricarinatus]